MGRSIEIVGFALTDGQAGVHIGSVRLDPADVIRSRVPNHDQPVFSARGFVYERAKLTIIESLVTDNHRRDLSDLDRCGRFGIGLDLKDVDGMCTAGTVPMTDIDTVAGDTEASRVTSAVEVAPAPLARAGILLGGYRDHPVQVFKVPEQVKFFLEPKGARLRIFFRGERIQVPFAVDPD